MADQTKQLGEMARAVGAFQLETLLDRKDEIVRMDFSALEKLGTLLKNAAANNGVCGIGCSRASQISSTE